MLLNLCNLSNPTNVSNASTKCMKRSSHKPCGIQFGCSRPEKARELDLFLWQIMHSLTCFLISLSFPFSKILERSFSVFLGSLHDCLLDSHVPPQSPWESAMSSEITLLSDYVTIVHTSRSNLSMCLPYGITDCLESWIIL